jgi:hypothetical protein
MPRSGVTFASVATYPIGSDGVDDLSTPGARGESGPPGIMRRSSDENVNASGGRPAGFFASAACTSCSISAGSPRTSVDSGAVYNFNHDNFLRGVKSNVFVNAPAGMLYPGDAGFPAGQTGLNKQWTNFSPRVGMAWDLTGDGRMALRASYALAYDFMAGDYHNINSSAPPFGNRLYQRVTLAFDLRDERVPGGVRSEVREHPPDLGGRRFDADFGLNLSHRRRL